MRTRKKGLVIEWLSLRFSRSRPKCHRKHIRLHTTTGSFKGTKFAAERVRKNRNAENGAVVALCAKPFALKCGDLLQGKRAFFNRCAHVHNNCNIAGTDK